MAVEGLAVDDEYFLGLIAKYQARDDTEPHHYYEQFVGDARGAILEAWRLP